jgi:hypothetical protein
MNTGAVRDRARKQGAESMRKSLLWVSLGVLGVVGAFFLAATGSVAQEHESETPQMMMFSKLEHANGVLTGLTRNDFDRIREEAQALSLISLEAHWRTDLPLSYAQYNSDFQWAVGGLIQMAEQKNLLGATLKYNQVVVSCVECHAVVRGQEQLAGIP